MWTALSFALLILGILVEANDGGGGTGAQAETRNEPISQPQVSEDNNPDQTAQDSNGATQSQGQDFKWYALFDGQNNDCAGAKIGNRWVIAAAGCIGENDNQPKTLTVGLNCQNRQNCQKSTKEGHSINAMGPEGNTVRMAAFKQLVFLLLAENTLDSDTNTELVKFPNNMVGTGKKVTTFMKTADNKLKQVEAELRTCAATGTGACLQIGCADYQSGPVMTDSGAMVGISAKICKADNGGPHIIKITDNVKDRFETAKVDGIGPNMKWYAEIKTDQGICRGAKVKASWVIAEKKCVEGIKTSADQKQFTLYFGRNCENPEKCKREDNPPSATATTGGKADTDGFVFLQLPAKNKVGTAPLASFDNYVDADDKVKTTTNSDKELYKVRHKYCTTGTAICLDVQCTANYHGAPVIRNDRVIGISAKDCQDGKPKILKITADVLTAFGITDTKRGSDVQQQAAEPVAENANLKWYARFKNKKGVCDGAKIGRQWAIADMKCIALKNTIYYRAAYFGLNCKQDPTNCRILTRAQDKRNSWEKEREGEFSFMKFDDVERPLGADSDIGLATFDKTVTVEQSVTTTILRNEKLKRIQVPTKKCNANDDTDTRTCLVVACMDHAQSAPVTLTKSNGDRVLVGISSEKCKKGDAGPQIRKITDTVIAVFEALPKIVQQGQPLRWFGTFATRQGTCYAAKIGSRWAIADAKCIEDNQVQSGLNRGTIPAVFSYLDCQQPARCTRSRGPWFRSEVPKAEHKIDGIAFMSIPDRVQPPFPDNSDIGLASYDDNVGEGQTVQTMMFSANEQMVEVHTMKCETDASKTCLNIGCTRPPSTLTRSGKLVGIHAGSCKKDESGPRIRKITSEVVEKFNALSQSATSGTDTEE